MNDISAEKFEELLKVRMTVESPAVAARMYALYLQKGATVQKAVLAWLETGEERDLQAAGHTVRQLKSRFKMNYAAAAFTIDWLMRDPMRATAALKAGVR